MFVTTTSKSFKALWSPTIQKRGLEQPRKMPPF